MSVLVFRMFRYVRMSGMDINRRALRNLRPETKVTIDINHRALRNMRPETKVAIDINRRALRNLRPETKVAIDINRRALRNLRPATKVTIDINRRALRNLRPATKVTIDINRRALRNLRPETKVTIVTCENQSQNYIVKNNSQICGLTRSCYVSFFIYYVFKFCCHSLIFFFQSGKSHVFNFFFVHIRIPVLVSLTMTGRKCFLSRYSYLQVHIIGHMVKDHRNNDIGNRLKPH